VSAGIAFSIRRTCTRVLVALAIASLLTGCPDNKGTKARDEAAGIERPLIIGVVGPETGEEAAYGTSVVAGVLAAAKRFNARGGIGGREITVLHFDDRSDTEQTIKIVQDLIARNAVAILSAPTGASTFAPVHLVNESRTIFFSIGSRRHLKASGPYVFRNAVPGELATEDLVGYAVRGLGFANFALVTAADNDFSLDLSAMFRRALDRHGGVVKVQADIYDSRTGGHDMGAVVAAIKRAGEALHAVIFTGGASDGVLLAREMRKAGLQLPLIGSEDLFCDEYLQGGDAVNDTLVYATFSADNRSPAVDAFVQDFGAAKPDRFAALAYDTFMVVADAIRAAGSTDASRIREAILSRKDFEGATGKTAFSRDNAPMKHPLIYRIQKSENGERAFVRKAGATPRP
jgi:branched-chain amino acid transport system substrate-binding protein